MSVLIENLISQGYIQSPRIQEAFRKVPRFNFLPKEGKNAAALQEEAEINAPLPIGRGQTISQPLTVALMLEMLAPRPGDVVLDVGSGSGWQACLLAHIVGTNGKVYALEIIPALKEFGEENARKFKFKNLHFVLGNGYAGYARQAPYDRIIVAAATPKVPLALKEQLKIGGVLVIPVGSTYNCTLTRLEKVSEDDFDIAEEPGFSFVPLVRS